MERIMEGRFWQKRVEITIADYIFRAAKEVKTEKGRCPLKAAP
jgi:hypothetical protein